MWASPHYNQKYLSLNANKIIQKQRYNKKEIEVTKCLIYVVPPSINVCMCVVQWPLLRLQYLESPEMV